ncbi:glucose-6-phosphate dehydrogenase [Herbiconiux sp. L3-i23]|uniref:glucose-6-phosphate dehydrogenase n=1 Tax=Herbiconiux sp. L3-i23 TaxID=2905871 RepID=UPI002055EFD0|nr:glucose-6-phosphate dehydrogenase [Herbiconiux sp. L3-i23]BDI23107.1 glucose-6-phosphate 1-dehydrogenase [Herbiconiux sp. L3-i23]
MSDVGTLVIFGASGDLTKRLLLPGLGSLLGSSDDRESALADDLVILGSGRSEKSTDEWRSAVREGLVEGGAGDDAAASLAQHADYVAGDPTDKADLERILGSVTGIPVLYFALPPSVVTDVIDVLADIELPKGTILALEKPFGSDTRSAAALNRKIAKIVPEHQVHRIDHFLGEPTVLGLLGMRFAGRILEPVWNAENIERVEIVYDEQLGLEGRAGYYDGAGALVDMLQSHLLQLLSIIAMEPPISIDEDDFRNSTAQVLKATRVWTGEPVLHSTDAPSRRARYTAGTIDGRTLPSYVDEEGVDPSRETETLAEMVVEVNTRRFAGVPFTLRSGKAIAEPRRQIEVHFRAPAFVPHGLTGKRVPERFVIGIHPQVFELDFAVNGEKDPFHLDRATLETEVASPELTQYGEVLRGVLAGDPTLSVRGDVAEQCWRIVTPVLEAWRSGDVPLDSYRAGSHGPTDWR